ncbi:MAG: type III-B CRISPR system CMR subunit Cmr7 [Saccharolobus sp.]|uniref:type III-B CRISPR system CMR subunit Cmr7 n=1 Tax=Saccharolobus TaxID=2100760 RepID=UPI001F0E19EA|nr:type III-B CRISPR system CMR subunit Cmr7 [Saccharolobus shibatae]MCH4816206.1 hypothetical protein [Saccharolobus shibatae]
MSYPQTQAQEYVFIPVIKNIGTIINNLGISINKNGHITSIDNKGIHNVLVLTGYAVDETSGILVPTLDPCDYVKGILVSAPNQQNNFSSLKLKIQPNKLYILRKSNLPRNEIIVKILYKNEHITTVLRTRFVAIDHSSVDDVFNTLKSKLTVQNQQIDDGRLKKDIEEIFNYYAVESS